MRRVFSIDVLECPRCKERMRILCAIHPADGAKAFQSFLIAPVTQARVRTFRYPDFDQQAW